MNRHFIERFPSFPKPIQIKNPEQKSRPELAEDIYAKVDYKINTILEIRQFINEHADKDPDELQIIFQKKLEEIEKNFGHDICQKKLQLLELKKESDLVEEELEKEAEKEKNTKKFNKLFNKSQSIDEQISDLKDDDVLFFLTVEGFFENITSKRKEVLELKQLFEDSREKFFIFLFEKLGLPDTNNQDDFEVRFDGYSINIRIKKDTYEKIYKKTSVGIHFSGTVINFIKERTSPENELDTINHENNHNISESFVDNNGNLDILSLISKKLERIERSKKNNFPDFIIEEELTRLNSLAEQYLHRQFDEIIGDIDSIAEGKIHTFLSDFSKKIDKLKKTNIEDEQLKLRVDQFSENGIEQISQILDKISSIFFAAQKTGMVEKAKAGIVLFGIEKMEKVERQLRHDNFNFETYQKLRPIISKEQHFRAINLILKADKINAYFNAMFSANNKTENTSTLHFVAAKLKEFSQPETFFDLENMQNLSELLEKNSDFVLSEDEKDILTSRLKKVKTYLLPEIPIEHRVENLKILLDLNKKLKINSPENPMENRIIPHYMIIPVFEAITYNEIESVSQIYESGLFEPEKLKGYLISALDIVIDTEVNNKKERKAYINKLKKSSFAEFLNKIGLEKQTPGTLK